MVRPAARRALVQWAREAYQVSERRACRAVGVERSMVRYRSRRPSQQPLRTRLRELAGVRLRAGYQQLHVLLRREGWRVNHKRVYRLYTEEGLALRRRRPRRHRSAVARARLPAPTQPNEQWAMDFMHDTLADGRAVRILTVLDVYARECVALVGAATFTGGDVARALTEASTERGLPQRITVDNGTEFTSRMLDHWAYWQHVALEFSRPGKPVDNPFIEAFNGTLRRELSLVALVPEPGGPAADARIVAARLQPPSSAQQFSGRPPGRVSGRRSIYPGPQPAPIHAGLVDQIR